LLTPGHAHESLARAYIHALAGQVGLTCSLREFDYLQVKSTTAAIVRSGEIAYDLDKDAYEDLRSVEILTPRILVLHVQPKPEQERLTMTAKGLVAGGQCYWISLKGLPRVAKSWARRAPGSRYCRSRWMNYVG
jgi:hypothetical protein